MSYDTISKFVRNLLVLQDSWKRLGGEVESWQGSWCWIWINFHSNFIGLIHVIWNHLQVHQELPCPLRLQEGSLRTPSAGLSGTSKSPERDLEDRSRLRWNLHNNFSCVDTYHLQCPGTSMSSKTPGRDLEIGVLSRFLIFTVASWYKILVKVSYKLLNVCTCHMQPFILVPANQEGTWMTVSIFACFL